MEDWTIKLIEYYCSKYKSDLDTLLSGRRTFISDRVLSFQDFLPREECPLNRIADPQMFLLCFFFDVLLDQAIHHANREHHQVYDQTYKPTKFRGILATASTNMPPRHLIILAVLHGPPLQLSESDFRAFCSWILTHLKGRIEDWALNAGMPCAKARSSVLSAMHTEIALDVLGASAQGGRQDSYFSITYPVEEVCERLKIVRDAVYASLEHVGP